MAITPSSFLNTPSGTRIPVYGMDTDWVQVGFEVMESHPSGRQFMAGDGIIWVDEKGHAVAIAGQPDERLMARVRSGNPL